MSYVLIRIFVLSLLFLSGCSIGSDHEAYMAEQIDLTIPAAENVSYTDGHGGFLGDGETFGKIEFSAANGTEFVSAIEHSEEWNTMPLPENLSLVMYGGERGGTTYGYDFAEEWDIPVIENGYWFFDDRHSESSAPRSDMDLLDRASFNFTLAVYDMDTNTLYYYELDT